MKKLAILASGSGTNAENIYRFFSRGSKIAVDVVIYDRKDAGVAARMQPYGVGAIYIPGSVWRERPEEILRLLRNRGIDMVVLAGFLRMVPHCICEAYRGRLLNIHPSLLPAYGGKGMYGYNVHRAVLEAGETKSGVTVHYVTDECDGGEIVMQEEVAVEPDDTPETLAARIHEVEYTLYPRAIVAALSKIDEHGEREQTPPPVPPMEEWAQKLGVEYRQTPPPAPQSSEAPQYTAAPQPEPIEAPEPQEQPACQQLQYQYPPRQPQAPCSEPMPPTNLIWAVLATVFCCFIPGVVAIVMASRVSSKYYAGDIEGARRASTATEWWIIASFVLGILSATLYLPLSLL